jgi:hypothetical protein
VNIPGGGAAASGKSGSEFYALRDCQSFLELNPEIPHGAVHLGVASRRYKRRNRIVIIFGRLKDWRRVATRYDRCPKVFLSAIAVAATVIFWP